MPDRNLRIAPAGIAATAAAGIAATAAAGIAAEAGIAATATAAAAGMAATTAATGAAGMAATAATAAAAARMYHFCKDQITRELLAYQFQRRHSFEVLHQFECGIACGRKKNLQI